MNFENKQSNSHREKEKMGFLNNKMYLKIAFIWHFLISSDICKGLA